MTEPQANHILPELDASLVAEWHRMTPAEKLEQVQLITDAEIAREFEESGKKIRCSLRSVSAEL